jgi:hypothetical protein
VSPESLDTVYLLLNAIVLPWWAVFLTAPRSELAGKLAGHAGIFVALGILYALLFGTALATAGASNASSPSPETMAFAQGLLATPLGFLGGWTHYLAFDLFTGAWIVRESQRHGLAPRVALVFTLMAGPIGLLIFLLQRFRHLRTLGHVGDGDLA